ncbi:MAG: DUF192 domain-containing protein [Candidatus Moranbacteria bacterium]|nr:DUF192 domain-containing protein [Candidatus Moranbacteria bacterium]
MIRIDQKALRLYALVMLPVAIAAAWFVFRSDRTSTAGMVRVPTGKVSVMVDGREFSAEVADTPSSRELGLGGRDSLCASCAMLFRFDTPGNYGFCMKGMRFPLDLVWIREGIVVHVEQNVSADSVRTMYPGTDATEVLETNADALLGVRVGDRIEVGTVSER